MEEHQLIQQLKNEKTRNNAFKELINLYQERLYWHIRRMVLSHDDTDDVLQNTFIKIYKNIHNFKEESALFSWMYRIATNEAITFLNKKAKLKGFSSDEMQEVMITNLQADEYFDGDEIQLKLQQAISKLPEKQRLVFNMKYFDDLKYEEISEILSTSIGALKASYHHAVKKIEEYITNH
ncbi:RNA polymerase sigma factor [Zhouia sp. PK063]|uniref:RNA polymerase sigma factor n=1 Tax=Zhouia sp. PK063 TaxID=3373602 RepID=UPI0037B4EDF4